MRDQNEILEPRAGMLDVEFSTFLAVVRYHSFSEAGERLNITQSTVSYRIRALERRMGLALLDRGRGRQGVELTAGGEAYSTSPNDGKRCISTFSSYLAV